MVHPTSERLQLYTEDRVGEWERQALADHLLSCERCTLQVSSLRELVRGLESMRELSLPADFATQVAEEAAPSERLRIVPARRSVLLQAFICLLILLTCCGLLGVVDRPVTDPTDDMTGAIDVLLGSPLQADASLLAVLAVMALAGLGVLASLLRATPDTEPRRSLLPSRFRRRE